MADIMRITSDDAKGNPKSVMCRMEPRKASRYAGQVNHDLRRGPVPGYVNTAKSATNDVLIPPPTSKVMAQKCIDLRTQRKMQRAMKSGGNVAYVGIIGFGSEAQIPFLKLTPEQQNDAYMAMALAITKRLNVSLEGLTVHRDETGPHAHFVIPAYNIEGVPLTETVKRGALMDLQTVIAEEIQNHAPGIERGRARAARQAAGATKYDTMHKTVAELHGSLESDLRAKMAKVETLTAQLKAVQIKLETNTRLAAAAQDELEALEADDAERIVKIQKRLSTYEKRVSTAQGQIDDAEAALQGMRAEIDRGRAASEVIIADAQAEAVEIRAVAEGDSATIKEAAKAEAMSIVSQAQGDAERMKAVAVQEAEDIRATAHEAGFDAGRAVGWAEGMIAARKAVAVYRKMTEDIIERYNGYASRVSAVMKDVRLSLKIRDVAKALFGEGPTLKQSVEDVIEAFDRSEAQDYIGGVTGQLQRERDTRILSPYREVLAKADEAGEEASPTISILTDPDEYPKSGM
jgi:hypothetical protein